MLSYMDQMAVCKPIREMIIQALARNDDTSIRPKAKDVPTVESILRSVSLRPDLNTREELKGFIIEHVLGSLGLTEIQRDTIQLNS
jgi:hypothetical protein